jgi:hypothetical protein
MDDAILRSLLKKFEIRSGRRVAPDGRAIRDASNRALEFPANKIIDRVLSAKREAKQLSGDSMNVLWVDLKHGLNMSAVDCVPFRTIVAKGTCFIGMHGVWHAFYGCMGDPFLQERSALEYPHPGNIYAQQRNGWFRDVDRVSCVCTYRPDGQSATRAIERNAP